MSLFINLLTSLRIVSAVVIFIFLTLTEMYWYALIFFIFASISDYFDGYLARKYSKTSELGEILDPIADKILIVFLFFGLSVSLSSYYIAFIGALIIAREIWVGALRDYNARQNNTNATKVTFLAKIKTTTQLLTIGLYLAGLALNNMLIILTSDIFLIISLMVTLFTGYEYTKKTFL